MTTLELTDQETELKERLIQRIESTHNLGVLRGMLLLLEEIPEDNIYLLSPDERNIVEERHREMESGVGIPHEEVCEKVEQWFQQKSR